MAAHTQTTRAHVKMMQSIRSSTPRVKTPTSKTGVRWTINSLVRSPDHPFLKDDMVFAKVGHAWYAGSISKRYPLRLRRLLHVHVRGAMARRNVEKCLLLFTKEEFERMVADATNLECAEAPLCLYYAAIEYNCKCKHFRGLD